MPTHLLYGIIWMKTFLVVTFKFSNGVGASTTYQPTEEEQRSVLLYMYTNMDEMDQYFM
jgi:hypothetical protein